MANLLDLAASPRVLNHAWRLLQKNPGLWVRGVPMDVMRRNVIEHIGELGKQLSDGRYRPAEMRCFHVDKADGERRLVCTADVRDKLAQRAVLSVIEPMGERLFLDSSYGFRPGRTIDMALSRIREHINAGQSWVVDADILRCFDSIPHRLVLDRLRRLTRDKSLVRLVHAWLESQPPKFRPGPGVGLPQGMVLSPFLCNLVLHDLDCFFERHGIRWVRFADDFVLLAPDRERAEGARRLAEKCLRRLGLELHPDKTKIHRSSKRHRFLGRRLPEAKERFAP